jgi:hypothetical protein
MRQRGSRGKLEKAGECRNSRLDFLSLALYF